MSMVKGDKVEGREELGVMMKKAAAPHSYIAPLLPFSTPPHQARCPPIGHIHTTASRQQKKKDKAEAMPAGLFSFPLPLPALLLFLLPHPQAQPRNIINTYPPLRGFNAHAYLFGGVNVYVNGESSTGGTKEGREGGNGREGRREGREGGREDE